MAVPFVMFGARREKHRSGYTVNRGFVAAGGVAGLLLALSTPSMAAGPLDQRCTNATYGFSVSYPDDWFTNQPAVVFDEPVAGCGLFAPFADFEVLPEALNVPILLKHQSASSVEGKSATVDGRQAIIVEAEVNGEAWYAYYVSLESGRDFVAFAFDNGSAPFDESRAVLDAMMSTLDLYGSGLPDVAMPADGADSWLGVTPAGLAALGLAGLLAARRVRPTHRPS